MKYRSTSLIIIFMSTITICLNAFSGTSLRNAVDNGIGIAKFRKLYYKHESDREDVEAAYLVAAYYGRMNIVKFLHWKNIDVNVGQQYTGLPAIYFALISKHINVAEEIAKQPNFCLDAFSDSKNREQFITISNYYFETIFGISKTFEILEEYRSSSILFKLMQTKGRSIGNSAKRESMTLKIDKHGLKKFHDTKKITDFENIEKLSKDGKSAKSYQQPYAWNPFLGQLT